MHGLIAAAGLSSRLQDLGERANKVLLDLGGCSLLDSILTNFEQAGVNDTLVVVGADALNVRRAVAERGRWLLNPFFDRYGILGSLWQARPLLDGLPFVFTTGDHYFAPDRLPTFLADQADADVLVDVDLKPCDEEDMKVFLNRQGKLRAITKTFLDSPCVGEFTGLVRCSGEGSTLFFAALERRAWAQGLEEGYVADVLCDVHKRWELAFHLSQDHDRVDVDFPCDAARARQLHARHASRLTRLPPRQTA